MKGVILDASTLAPEDLELSPILNSLSGWKSFELTSPEQTASRIREAGVVVTNKVVLGEKEFSSAPELKLVALTATGVNNIDLKAAAAAGVRVVNVAAYCTNSVVQHAFALLFSLIRKIPEYSKAVDRGSWVAAPSFCLLDYPVMELSGKKLLILGYGELGRAMGEAGKAFGMELLIAARPGKKQLPGQENRRPLNELLPEADVLSLHCPLTPDTENIIDAGALALMKPGGILLNTARGGLIVEAALAEALKERRLGGAGLDVLSREPPGADNPLLEQNIPNLIITPHMAWASREARQNLVNEVGLNIKAFLKGEERNLVV